MNEGQQNTLASKTFHQEVESDRFFGKLLVSKGLLTQEQLAEALSEQRLEGGRLGEVLFRLKLLKGEDVTGALAEHLSIEYIRFDDEDKINMNIARLVPEAVAKRFCLVAVGEVEGKVLIAMTDPLNVIAIDTVTLKINRQIKVAISSPCEILHAIDMVYHGTDIEEQSLRDLVEFEVRTEDDEGQSFEQDQQVTDEIETQEIAMKAPVIRFVDLLLSQAIKSHASDIHIEPQENSMIIRMRIDGVLRDMVPPARKMQAAVLTRIKILSSMDIAERRLPQDGRFKTRAAGNDIDVRVSVIPAIYGEKIVMRILDATSLNRGIEELGIEPKYMKVFKAILKQPHGIILVTGPTGSGKSTTLYSSLNYLKDPAKNITTVEDPVEYRLNGINQIQVKSDINLTFASCLRAILRQDPDIILIGEIRDKETVDIAIKASLTGHLVLSTFHTNDAPSAISRLNYMGIESYLLASALNLIIAQRLVKRICDKCKEPVNLTEETLLRLELDPQQYKETTFYQGKGCAHCGQRGYAGRLPIFEFLVIDNDMRDLIIAGANESELRNLARQKEYGGLRESGISKMLQGLTTAEEVLSVTYSEDATL